MVLQREVNHRLARSCGEGVLRMTLKLVRWCGRRSWTVYQEEVAVLTARPTNLPDLASAHMRCVYSRCVIAVEFQCVSFAFSQVCAGIMPLSDVELAVFRCRIHHQHIPRTAKYWAAVSIMIIAANRAGTLLVRLPRISAHGSVAARGLS